MTDSEARAYHLRLVDHIRRRDRPPTLGGRMLYPSEAARLAGCPCPECGQPCSNIEHPCRDAGAVGVRKS